MNSQFSPKLSIVLAYSREEALRLQNSFIGPEHLLLGIIRQVIGIVVIVVLLLRHLLRNIFLQGIPLQEENCIVLFVVIQVILSMLEM